MEQKIAPKDKKLRKQMHGKFNNTDNSGENK
jgi:hypothetical protein